MSGFFGNGTILTVGTAIAELESISGPSISMDTIDVTTHNSTGGIREFVGGMIDGRITSYNVCYTKLLRMPLMCGCQCCQIHQQL